MATVGAPLGPQAAKVALTGAAGRIGSVLRVGLRSRVRRLRLLDIAPLRSEGPSEEVMGVDLRDAAATTAALAGVQQVIHLAAIAGEAPFPELLQANLLTTFHVFEAARRHGVRRVIFASSNHATGFYPTSQPVRVDMPVRPDSLYGVSKIFGENLGRLYADKFGLEVVCIRIGSFAERPTEPRHLSTWLSHRDAIALFTACLQAPRLHYLVVYGASANTRSWWVDDGAARLLGYRPEDNAEEYAGMLPSAAHQPDPGAGAARQGGDFTAIDRP
jgi:uronate dehydrogenase